MTLVWNDEFNTDGKPDQASIQIRGFRQWQFGRFEIRARIETAHGAWPAIWTLGIEREWPSNGEIDISVQTVVILAELNFR